MPRTVRSRTTRHLASGATTIACLLGIAAPAAAQSWPDRPIRMVVHFPPGGIADFGARTITERLSPLLGQPIVIENRPGAGGQTGTEAVVRAKPDGYTLLFATDGPLAYAPVTNPKLGYDPLKDLLPVASVASYSQQVVVNPDLPVKSVAELVAWAKARPGQLNFATPGTASSTHFGMELFMHMAGVQAVHVPYKGSAQALTDLAAGNVHVAFDGAAKVHVDAGRIRLLATTGEIRDPRFPDTPTVAEAGLPGYRFVAYQAILAPAGTPPAILTRLTTLINGILDDPEVKARLATQGLSAMGGPPQGIMDRVRDGIAAHRKTAADARLTFE